MENGKEAELLTLFVDVIDSTEVIYVGQQNGCFDHWKIHALLLGLAFWSKSKTSLKKNGI